MAIKQKSATKVIGTYLVLCAIAFLMLFPLLWLIGTSFKSPAEDIFTFPPQIFPSQPTFDNFITVWDAYPFGLYLYNSAIVAFLAVGLNLLLCSLAAYPLARLDFRGREFIFALVLATIMIPFQIVMIPLYIMAVNLGLRNTYLGIVLPNLT
ncbi:MAG: carbohydrate ABC transporter permease [Waterburya sp.]